MVIICFSNCGSSKLFSVFCFLRTPLISSLEPQNVQFPPSAHRAVTTALLQPSFQMITEDKIQTSATWSSKNTHWQRMLFWGKKKKEYFFFIPQRGYVWQSSLHLRRRGAPAVRPARAARYDFTLIRHNVQEHKEPRRAERTKKPDTLNQ